MENKQNTIKHENTKLVLTNRNDLSLNGVNKVYSATESCVSIVLGSDDTLIEGNSLHVTKLDIETGIIALEGTVNSIKFGKNKNSKNFIKRIFS